jgi:ribosomal silencing factor RsfS
MLKVPIMPEWVDYVNIVVHVPKQIREYYNIENLWEMQNTTIENKY